MSLTERQLQIAKLKHEGLTNREIARRLKTSESNVSQTLKTVINKIETVQDSTNILIEMGLISKQKYVIPEYNFKRITIPTADLRKISNQSTTVAVLGPKGTNTEKAAKDYWGSEIITIPKFDFELVFDAVENEEVDFGLVPVYETNQGYIKPYYDLIRERNVQIVGKTMLEVKHCLLGKKEVQDLQVICSHPRALSVCRKYLKEKFPKLARMETESTAQAAVIASGDPHFGAIGSEWLAEEYDLNLLERNIASNITTFLGITSKLKSIDFKITQQFATDIVVTLKKDVIGLLSKILEPFTKQGININILQSESQYPSKDTSFLMTFEGSHLALKSKKALKEVEKIELVESVQILGSYPVNIGQK